MRVLKPIVAEVSPNLYTAAQRANMTPAEQNNIEQMSWAVKKNRELNRMNSEDARDEFNRLDPDAQEGLKFFFSNQEYMQKPPDFGDRAIGALKFGAKLLASPLIGVFKVAGAYSKAINTPYLVARQVAQGENIFDSSVWSDAWDGTDIYDSGSLKAATDVYGKANVYVAKGLLAGKKPGEILEAYGTLTPEITKAVEEAFNNPDNFKNVLDATKMAQVSPGRDVIRWFGTKPPKNGGISVDYIDGKAQFASGALDFVYQIVLDPFTWLSGGAISGARKGTQLAEMVLKASQSGDVAYGVRQAFKDPSVAKLWDEQLGKDIERMANAEGAAAKAVVRREIGRRYAGYNNDAAIDFLVKNKVFNAQRAEQIFSEAENVGLLLSGRVDGITYRRNGIATARNQRRMATGLNNYLDSVFNARVGAGPRKTTEELDASGEQIYDILRKSGEETDKAVNPNIKELFDIDQDINKLRYKMGRYAARNPAGQQIIVGDEAVKTIDTFRNVARLVVSRDMADFMAQKFLTSSEDEQVVIVRNLYAAVMHRAGLGDNAEGQELMQEVLKKTLNERAGFTTTVKTEIDPAFANVMPKDSLRFENETPVMNAAGAIQPSQLAGAIGPLPLEDIAIKANEIRSKSSLMKATKGATQSKWAKDFVDFWSIFTLFPRLGIRSAIDEGFMYALTAPAKEILSFAKGEGRRLGRGSSAYTGSASAEGIIAGVMSKTFKKAPSDYMGVEARNELIEQIAKQEGVSPAELSHLRINQEIASRAAIFLKGLDDEARGYWAQAMVHHPDILGSMASSISARTSLGGRFDDEILTEQINISELTKALNSIGKEATGKKFKFGKYSEIDVDKLRAANPKYVTLAHYDNWYIRFAAPVQHGKLKLPDNYRVAPAVAFFANNGLRTPDDLVRASDSMMEYLGFTKNQGDFWVKTPGNEAAVQKFLSYFSDTVFQRQMGKTDEEITQIYVNRMLMDMRDNFHGGPNLYNANLYDAVRKNYDVLKAKEIETGVRINGKWQKAAASVDVDTFEDATKGFQPRGFINTRVEFPNFTDLESAYKRTGNKMMELMDKQVNGILRQPAVMVSYVHLRKNYAGIEKAYADKVYKGMIGSDPVRYATPQAKARARNNANDMAEKRFTELAMEQAADTVLKFADNPSIRSNFAVSVRTVGRFYRATEDFQRRMYRLKDVSPRVLYRMRLAHQGLNASGSIYEDAEGEPYVMMPMDSIIFKATDTTIRALTPGTDNGYKQPMFNDFTFKLTMANPSFSPDAGLPTLSGPIAALSVLGMKHILGNVPVPGGDSLGPLNPKILAQELDNYALGSIGDNMDIVRAVVPSTLLKLYQVLPVNEKTRQEVTAAQQAIAYNAAAGRFLDANSTNEEKYQYLKNIRISAHNIVAMRAILGLISPVTPTAQESKGVPDYLLDVGITGLRSEFWDIFESIKAKYGDDIQDPYEMALTLFTGKYPGKIAYTVSRDEKQTKVLMAKTTEMRNWAIKNRSLVGAYGEAAYIFAPNSGDFNAGVYNWLNATGLLEDKTLDKYYDDVLVAQDKQKYYDVASWQSEQLGKETRISERKKIIELATATRQGLLDSNPLLLNAITGGGNEIATEERMLASVKEMIMNPESGIADGTVMKMKTAVQAIEDFIQFSNDESVRSLYNATTLKRQYRDRVNKIIFELGNGDPAVQEAARAIFNSILKYYSRDTYKAEV
jgi:hypothetical protein